MDVSLFIRRRLEEFGLEQRELAQAAQVTESYISQLLTRKKAPPAPARTDIYEKMDKFLKLPNGELARLAEMQRKETRRRGARGRPAPLFPEVRAVILRKCHPEHLTDVRTIFEQQAFGELEQLVTRYLLEIARKTAGGRPEADDVSLLEPSIERWRVDLTTFAVDVVLAAGTASPEARRLEFMERDGSEANTEEPGFKEFLDNRALSGSATPEEIAFLRGLEFKHARPTPLYYYHELQNLRDPLNFRAARTPR